MQNYILLIFSGKILKDESYTPSLQQLSRDNDYGQGTIITNTTLTNGYTINTMNNINTINN